MIEETFAQGQSAVHRTQPGLRVVMATLYSFTVALLNDLPLVAGALLFSVVLTAAARLPAVPLIKRLTAVGGLMLMIWLVVPWSYAGETLAQIGPLTISRQGVRLCLLMTGKALAILLAFTALVATMHIATLGHTLSRLGMPSKLIQLMLLAYRYIFVIEQEYRRLYRAAKMRNFRPANNLHTYRTFAFLVGMLFVHASERARRVHLAMKCRGFKGRFHALHSYPATVWNPVLAASVGGASMVLILLEAMG